MDFLDVPERVGVLFDTITDGWRPKGADQRSPTQRVGFQSAEKGEPCRGDLMVD